MPLGMQIVGKPYADKKVFQVAHAWQGVDPNLFNGKKIPDFRS